MLLKDNAFVKRKFIRMSLASSAGWIISLLSEMFDSFLAGNYIEADAVAGIEVATPTEYIFYAIAILCSYGLGILYTRAQGQHDKVLSQKIAGMGLILTFGMGVLVGATLYLGAPWFVGLYGCTENVAYYAVTFIQAKAVGMPLYYIFWGLFYPILYDGDEIVGFLVDTTGVLLGLIVPSLMTKWWGFLGLAYSYVPPYIYCVLLLSTHFLKKRNSISFKPYFSFKVFWELIKLGSAVAITSVYLAIVDIYFNGVIIDLFGELSLAAYTVTNLLLNLAESSTGILTGAMIFMSVCYGEGSFGEIRSILKMVMKVAVGAGLCLSVALLLVAPYWPSIFGIEDPIAQDYAVFAGYVIPSTYVFSFFIYIFTTYFPMVNKTLYGHVLAITYMLITPLCICAPLAHAFGFKAMIMGFASTPVVALALSAVFCLITGKKKDFPYYLPENKEKEYHYNLRLTKESIVYLKDVVLDTLGKEQVSQIVLHEVSVVLEDALVYIGETNKKKVVAEVTILLNDEHLRLVIKDSGKIFDLVQDMKDAKSFRAYTMDRLTSMTYEKENDIANSFNRNTFSWTNQLFEQK